MCNGPGCEDFYPDASLSVLSATRTPPVFDLESLDVWTDARMRYDGQDAHGTDWAVAPIPGGEEVAPGVLIGQPDAEQVMWKGLFEGSPRVLGARLDDPLEDPDIVWSDGRLGAFGAALALQLAPDGTGNFDLWVGAPAFQSGRGRVFLYRNAANDKPSNNPDAAPPIPASDLEIKGITPNDRLGAKIVPCGDLTGDERRAPDFVVTIPWFTAPERWSTDPAPDIPDLSGAVLLVRGELLFEQDGGALRTGSVEPWELGPIWWGATEGEGVGSAVICDRDLNGDGRIDIVIGAPWSGGGQGRIYFVSVSPIDGQLPDSGPLGRPGTGGSVAWGMVEGTDPEGWFGMSLVAFDRPAALGGSAGGSWLAVGEPGASGGQGAVQVFDPRGASSLTAPAPVVRFVADPARDADHVGRTLYAGDLDGDGQQDLIIGAPDYRGEGRNAFDTGRLFVWPASGSTAWIGEVPVEDAPLKVVGNEPFQRIGRGVVVMDTLGDEVTTGGADPDELWIPTRSDRRTR